MSWSKIGKILQAVVLLASRYAGKPKLVAMACDDTKRARRLAGTFGASARGISLSTMAAALRTASREFSEPPSPGLKKMITSGKLDKLKTIQRACLMSRIQRALCRCARRAMRCEWTAELQREWPSRVNSSYLPKSGLLPFPVRFQLRPVIN